MADDDSDLRETVRQENYRAQIRKNYNRVLIDKAFPTQGKVQPSYMGSQSDTPEPSDVDMALAKGVMRAQLNERSGTQDY